MPTAYCRTTSCSSRPVHQHLLHHAPRVLLSSLVISRPEHLHLLGKTHAAPCPSLAARPVAERGQGVGGRGGALDSLHYPRSTSRKTNPSSTQADFSHASLFSHASCGGMRGEGQAANARLAPCRRVAGRCLLPRALARQQPRSPFEPRSIVESMRRQTIIPL